MTPAPRVLVADDQPDVLEALRLLLKGEGFEAATASSPAGVLQAVEKGDFDLALIDLNYTRDTTSGREGLDLLSMLRELDGTLPVVVMTAWGSVEGAVEAMRRGARDYIEKPWDNERLLTTIRTHVELGRALRRSQKLEGENRHLKGEGAPKLIAGLQDHAAGPRVDRAGRSLGRERAHRRRARNRQGGRGALAPRGFRALEGTAGSGQRGWVQRGGVRERALRPREGGVHRRQDRPRGLLRARRRRHALPGRDRRMCRSSSRPSS